jgi:predicted enzyme related to lactoylglutathione lyase
MSNAFVHCELSTDDVGAAKKFYKKVFDWKLSEVPAMKYTMIDVGRKDQGGGITEKMMGPQQPTAWLPYVEVESVKKTIAKAEKGGARIVLPFQAIGETMGAVGIFIDPTGAALGVYERGKPAKKAGKKKGKKK